MDFLFSFFFFGLFLCVCAGGGRRMWLGGEEELFSFAYLASSLFIRFVLIVSLVKTLRRDGFFFG